MSDMRRIKYLFAVGRIFSPFYSWAMLIRSWMYKKGWFLNTKVSLPVISVGNLTMGGTGKTPMVQYIAMLLVKNGWHPAIISRGYGGRSRKAVNLVSDGREVKMGAVDAGDEPVFLAQSLPGVPVITGRKRAVTAGFVEVNKMADVLIMDDGFQHMALARGMNIVLFTAKAPLGNGRVFPGGSMREPLSALDRADCFVITGVEAGNEKEAQTFIAMLCEKFADTPIFTARYVPNSLFSVNEQRDIIPADLDHGPLLSFCGIANPKSFSESLTPFNVLKSISYSDHHSYTQQDVDFLVAETAKHGCRGLITTEKDYVKLGGFKFKLPLWVLKVGLKLPDIFADFLLAELHKM